MKDVHKNKKNDSAKEYNEMDEILSEVIFNKKSDHLGDKKNPNAKSVVKKNVSEDVIGKQGEGIEDASKAKSENRDRTSKHINYSHIQKYRNTHYV